MSNALLSGSREPIQDPILLDLNALYHPQRRSFSMLGLLGAIVPLFGYGWQAMTQDPESHLRHELARRIDKRRSDEANLILMLQLAAMLDCHCLHVALPYVLEEAQLARIRQRLPRWQLSLSGQRLVAQLPLSG